jgi:hypothetical protein
MATTYKLIASNVLSSAVANIFFTSIPQTYTDLVLRISSRSDALSLQSIRYEFNTASGTPGSQTFISGSGSSVSSGNLSGVYYNSSYNSLTGSNFTANTFSSDEIYISNYTGTAKKVSSVFGVSENNASSNMNVSANLFDTSSAALTSIILSTSTGDNFVSGSSFYLYGIKNS